MEQRTTPKSRTPSSATETRRLERRLEKSLRDLDALLAQPAQLRDVDRNYREALDLIERRLRGRRDS